MKYRVFLFGFLLINNLYASEKNKNISNMQQSFQCGGSEIYERACQALKQFTTKENIEFKETGGFNGERFIDVGYINSHKNKHERQLVIIEYRWSRNFHKKINFPDKLCTLYVQPEDAEQLKVINKAISKLEEGIVPSTNSAYKWALEYDISNEHCKAIALSSNKKSLISKDDGWILEKTKTGYVFFAKD